VMATIAKVGEIARQSMIRKSGYRFSLATNAKRLRGDHAQTKRWSAMTIRRKVIIPLWANRYAINFLYNQ
jgi:hypothetical protein